MLFNFKYRKEVFQNFGYKIYSLSFFKDFIILFLHRVKIFIKNRIKTRTVNRIKNIKTINDCIEVLNDSVDYNKLPLKK